MKKFAIIVLLFLIDRIVKYYFVQLQETGNEIDFFINPFLNFILVWNTGIGFGLVSLEANAWYHSFTAFIAIINIILIYIMLKLKGVYSIMFAVVIGGSLGNLFDRVYYYAVPDFIDLHYGNFHWFIFNIADIFITIGILGLIILEMKKKD